MRNFAYDIEAQIPGYTQLYITCNAPTWKIRYYRLRQMLWLWWHNLPSYRPVTIKDFF